jgi:hypothetical protein
MNLEVRLFHMKKIQTYLDFFFSMFKLGFVNLGVFLS